MDIRTFQTLPDAERQVLFGWGDDIFDTRQHALQWRTKDWRRVPLYRSLGWQVVEPGVLIEHAGSKVLSPVPVMILPFGDEPWSAERVDLGSLPW